MITRAVTLLSRLGLGLAGIAALLCLFLVSAGVGTRYFFSAAQSWIDESATWLVIIMVMLAMPDAQRSNANIGVDALVQKLSRRGQRLLALFSALSVIAVAVIMLVSGIEMVKFSQMIGVMANTLAWLPLWWIQVFLPIGGALLLLVAVLQFVAALRRGWQPPANDDPVHGTRSHE